MQSPIETFKDTYCQDGDWFVNEATEKKYVSLIFILNLNFSLFYSNKTLLIFLLNNLCYRKKWLTSRRRRSRKPKSLLVNALHRDMHSLPLHVRDQRRGHLKKVGLQLIRMASPASASSTALGSLNLVPGLIPAE